MSDDKKQRLNILLEEVAAIVRNARDEEIVSLLGEGQIDGLLRSIAEPKTRPDQTIYEYLLENKTRLALLAIIRLAITTNYSLEGQVNGIDCFVSPTHIQWFPEGVMFLQGEKRFAGLMGLYQSGTVRFALAKRDAVAGEMLSHDAFEFVEAEEAKRRANQKSIPNDLADLEAAISELNGLIHTRVVDEAKYQNFFERFPWVFGAQYEQIDPHKNLDDANIPDFTGVRVRDGARDIFEIKHPFQTLFTQANDFSAEFNSAWNQGERYLSFARDNRDYLHREKGLRFENPRCYIIAGFDLTDIQRRSIRRKEGLNPAIEMVTYNDVIVQANATIQFIKALKTPQ